MAFFTPKWMSKDENKAFMAVKKIIELSDYNHKKQKELEQVALNAAFNSVRLLAIKNLKSSLACIEAINKINDNRTLTQIVCAEKEVYCNINTPAIKRMSEPDYEKIRITAVNKITDIDALMKIEASFYDGRAAAKSAGCAAGTFIYVGENIKKAIKARIMFLAASQKQGIEYLVFKARHGETKENRLEAVKSIDDPILLLEIALDKKKYDYDFGGNYTDVCIAAVKKIKDTSLLLEVLNSRSKSDIRSFVLEELTDINILINIAYNENEKANIRLIAARKIKDNELIEKLSKPKYKEEEQPSNNKIPNTIKENPQMTEMFVNSDEGWYGYVALHKNK